MSDRLEGKLVVITGGGSGIGAATAVAFARAGANIAICGRRKRKLNQVEEQLKELGILVYSHSVDVRREDQINDFFTAVTDTFGRVDILVNSAGICDRRPIVEVSTERWDQIMDTNLRGAFLCCRAVLPLMLKQAEEGAKYPGIIVNVGSEAGKFGYANLSTYSASKWGLMGLTKVIDAEVSDKGIKAMILCPGMVDTAMMKGQSGRAKERSLKAEEVADTILWLCLNPANVKISEILMQTMLNPWG